MGYSNLTQNVTAGKGGVLENYTNNKNKEIALILFLKTSITDFINILMKLLGHGRGGGYCKMTQIDTRVEGVGVKNVPKI